MLFREISFGYVALLSCFTVFASGATLLPAEVEALREISQTLGKTNWNFSVDPCSGQAGWATANPALGSENAVLCDCSDANGTVCHVVTIMLNSRSLPGVLPQELVKLPYLQELSLARNYLNGSIPKEWGSMRLMNISLTGNRLSSGIPVELTNITTLRVLMLEYNQMSGPLPPQLGNLINMETLLLSSNYFTGPLPETLSKLTNLKDFWINDNKFSGKIPNFIQNWTNLETIRIQASGLEGPIPSGISLLTKINDMRISDLNGSGTAFPQLSSMRNMVKLILKSCGITGVIPDYIGSMTSLQTLDLSFNKLTGRVPSSFNSLRTVHFIFLTGNALIGPVPEWMINAGNNIDLSYNNFTLGTSSTPNCQQQNVNLFGSSSLGNNSNEVVPCLKSLQCPKNTYSFHINCGGDEATSGSILYEEDVGLSGASTFFMSQYNWAFSSTGKYLDNTNTVDYYITRNTSELLMRDYSLYMTARVSPLSLTYYGFCLLNGNYTVKLHFAEIIFTNGKTYGSLGRRLFDIYIQGKLVLQDFNIEDEAGGVGKAVVKNFTATVTGNTLEIRFYWAGKGTTGIPSSGVYGPLVSAISVDPGFKPPLEGGKKTSPGIVVGIVLSVSSLVVIVLAVLWWKGCFGWKDGIEHDLKGLDLKTRIFTLRHIVDATNNFNSENKIGEGGFGPVFKGCLLDGTMIAVKQLSSKSNQGNREFVNEIGLISALRHPNLVRLYGCCIEGNQLLLVYEYMENNSLARALFGNQEYQLKLAWETRCKICIGIARALSYLHEESRLKIVHRDIKATNVLLDKDLNPKVSDFGLAKLDEEEKTHTRIAGTFGYMAPEYAMKGQLTDKVDVYSFGVVTLEIVSGKSNAGSTVNEDGLCLLDWAVDLQEKGNLMDLVDPSLESNYIAEEVLRMIKVALLCTHSTPALRPTMSSVLSMLEGRTVVQEMAFDSHNSSGKIELTDMLNHHKLGRDQSMSSNSQLDSVYAPLTGSSTPMSDLYSINLDT